MDIVDATLQDFGSSMGLPSLQWNEHGILKLDIEGLGSLFLEKTDELITLYLLQPLNFPTVETFRQALALCHPAENPLAAVSAGLSREEELAFITHLLPSEFNLPNLELKIEALKQLHNRVANLAK